jgi:hypothetical protein
LNSELRVSEATLGGDSPRRTLRYDPERPPNGTIEQNPGVGSSSGPNVSRFFYHFYLRACQDRRADFSTWNIRRAKGRVFLSGESVDPGTTTTLELDADQDFAIVSMRSEFRGSGNVLVNTYEHVKVQDQFWVPAFATSTQRDKLGQVIVEFQYEIDINTVRVNQPIEGSIFDLEFPKGTRVYDALTKQSYFVGGDSRSSGDLQELLAKAEQMSGSPPSAIQPSPGALRAKRLSWSTVAFYSTLGITGLVLAVCGMMIRRRSGYSR